MSLLSTALSENAADDYQWVKPYRLLSFNDHRRLQEEPLHVGAREQTFGPVLCLIDEGLRKIDIILPQRLPLGLSPCEHALEFVKVSQPLV